MKVCALCRESNRKVSFWLGKFSSNEDLDNFVKDEYDEEGDVSSAFMKETEIEFCDSYKREVLFYSDRISKDALLDFSYADTFIDQVSLDEQDLRLYNAIILVYDSEYDNDNNSNSDILKFMGSLDYSKSKKD